MTGPWSLIDRITEAERMAAAKCSLDAIVKVTGLTRQTAECVKARVTGETNFERLKRNTLDRTE